MDQGSDEFARLADAERWLCEEAAPLLDDVVRSIEHRAGITIREIRVTFDDTNGYKNFSSANCTIVRADFDSAPKTGSHVDGTVASKSNGS